MKNRLNKKLFIVPGLLAGIGLALSAANLQATEVEAGNEITRDTESLRDYLSIHPVAPERVNTALVFTNTGKQNVRVACVAFNARGEVVDLGWTRVPARGMRFALASDISGGRDFIGNVKCTSGGHVLVSAVLLGPGLTDLSVEQMYREGGSSLRFPLVATY